MKLIIHMHRGALPRKYPDDIDIGIDVDIDIDGDIDIEIEMWK